MRSLSGTKIYDIAVELEAIVADGQKYSYVIILAGSNNASLPVENVDLECTMSAFNNAVSAAKKLTDNVAVAEIPPGFQPLHVNDNIAALNANIMAAATELSVTFIPNHTYFFSAI